MSFVCHVQCNPLVYSFIVFKHVILILRKDKYILWKIGLYFWGFGEKLNIFYGFGERRQILLGRRAGIWGDQCIIFRDQDSTDPLGASVMGVATIYAKNKFACIFEPKIH